MFVYYTVLKFMKLIVYTTTFDSKFLSPNGYDKPYSVSELVSTRLDFEVLSG
jgi:hypothetical protein